MVKLRRYLFVATWAALCAALGACAQPYDYRNIKPTWAVRNSPIPVPRPKIKPTVRVARHTPPKSGQSLWQRRIAVKEGVSVIRVQAGDSVYGLSRRHGVSPAQIIALNNLRAPYSLNKGQSLRLRKADGAPAPKIVRAAAPVVQKPVGYTVKRGDTVYGVAKRKGVSAAALIAVNGLKAPYALRVGQRLAIPASGTSKPAKVQLARSPQAGQATFIWPATGRVVSGYGVKANGLRNDGINIAATRGAPVFASASGEVLYAGDRLRAFGNLILIRHKNGYISTYGHNQKLLVTRGQKVQQGQQIATVGATGSVASPQLHFELRRNSSAIDPMRYLGRTRMASNGR